MEFQKLVERAIGIREQYAAHEKLLYGSPWSGEEIALGFVGDVGDLAKLIVAESGKRNIAKSKEKLAHELSDCLWSVIALSYIHEIDLERSFVNTMNELAQHLAEYPS